MVDFAKNDVRLVVECEMCGIDHKIMVGSDDLKNYNDGTLVQDAFPYLSPGERELLISRTCGKCFDSMFGGDVDDEDL